MPQFTLTRITNKAMVAMNESDDVEVGYRSIFNLLASGLRLVWFSLEISSLGCWKWGEDALSWDNKGLIIAVQHATDSHIHLT